METALLPLNSRFIRQADFVPQDQLLSLDISVIGVGAIGRNVAIQLASIGARKLQLIDFDQVSPSNVTTQGFRERDIGSEKVGAVAQAIQEIDSEIQVEGITDIYRPNQTTGRAVFLCVDKIQARKRIWRKVKNTAEVVIDGRMLGETMQVLTVHNPPSMVYYETTLFPPEEQEQGRCTAHSTIYCATIAAGLMVHQFTRWLRGFPVDNHIALNLLASELFNVTVF